MAKKQIFDTLGTPYTFAPVDFCNKEQAVGFYTRYFLARCQSMIQYEGLPDTIPERDFKRIIQPGGFACITDKPGKLYAMWGGLGGVPNPYYLPTMCTVANPALKFSANLEIGKDCEIVPHDSYYLGLIPVITRYATLLAENDITLKIACINSRLTSLIACPDDSTKESAQKYLSDIEKGKLGALLDNAFIDSIKVQPLVQPNQSITPMIEYQQYLKASLWNDLGLNANYNMKREAINEAEAGLNENALLPFIDDILETQTKAFEKVNDHYGTKITVRLGSAWEDVREKIRDTSNQEGENNSDRPDID